MTTKFGNPAAPADEGAAVVKSDATVLDPPTRALFVGTAGDVTVRFAAGEKNIETLKNVANGTVLPISVDQVRAATTAADIVALF